VEKAYSTLGYNSKARWLSYWYQISEALEVNPDNILVIGKGSGVTEVIIRYLTRGAVKVVTADIDRGLRPDVTGDVVHLPFKDNTFDAIICCQVLEHLPFKTFPEALRMLYNVARRRVIISLPHRRKHIKIAIDTPFIEDRIWILKNPFTKKTCTSRQHHWEIGRGVSRNQVLFHLNKLFYVEKEFFNEINCEHRFFILKKRMRDLNL
jgi:ubiquinone/menaquinone biosynthesis C-methylase UbiE